MTRRLALVVPSFALVFALVGCGGENGLTVRGSALVDRGSARTGFEFPQDVRIDDVEASTEGRLTGACEMRRTLSGSGALPEEMDQWSVILDIRRGGAVEDEGLGSLSVMQRTDAEPGTGGVELELGTTLYASDGTCDIRIDYAVADSGMVGIGGTCEVVAEGGETASVDIVFDIVGCHVAN